MNQNLTSTLLVPETELRRVCEPLGHSAKSSDELPTRTPYLGQQRAIDAIRFGIELERPGMPLVVVERIAHGIGDRRIRAFSPSSLVRYAAASP